MIWRTVVFTVVFLALPLGLNPPPAGAQNAEIAFDHNHTLAEVVDYLEAVVDAYPTLARIHTIGKSYEGRDLLVLEITNQATGDGLSKPGFWMDGNLHASEVMGAEVCLKNIDTLVKGYGNDPFITDLVDTRTIYIMPKLNPDGSDYYLTQPRRNAEQRPAPRLGPGRRLGRRSRRRTWTETATSSRCG